MPKKSESETFLKKDNTYISAVKFTFHPMIYLWESIVEILEVKGLQYSGKDVSVTV